MEGKLREQYREGVHSMSPKKTPSLQTPPSHDIKAIQNPNSSASLPNLIAKTKKKILIT